MRIAHLESSPGWGGQEIRIIKESEGLRQKGHQIFFLCAKNALLFPKAKERGFVAKEISFKKFSCLPSLLRILFFLYRHKIDRIITHSSMDSWLGGIAGKILKIPVLRMRHLSTPVRSGLNSIMLYHWLTDFVVTTCSEIIPTISKQSKKPIEYFQCIPTGIDSNIEVDQKKATGFREKYQIASHELLVGMVCFMRSWKGVDDFISAAAKLSHDSSIRWIIIGGGHSQKYQEKVKELGLDRFIFTGHLEDPLSAIAALDIFALLSTSHEGISQASLQAAFLQKPLITTPIGGLKEVCIPSKTGIQVEPFSPDQVVEAVLKLKDRALRHHMGKEGRLFVLERFTYQKMIEEMEKVLYKISAKRV